MSGRRKDYKTEIEMKLSVEEEIAETKNKKKRANRYDRLPTEEEKARVHRWATWSMQPHTPDEIREEILNDYRCVCFSYVCGQSKIPSSFMDEFVVLSTCLLDKTNYEKDYEAVKNMLFAKLGIGEHNADGVTLVIKNREGTHEVTVDNIADRIDWLAIGLEQRIDLYTAERYAKFLPWDKMTPRCGLSKLFIDANKEIYCPKVKRKDDTLELSLDIFSDDYDDDDDFDDDIDSALEAELEAELSNF